MSLGDAFRGYRRTPLVVNACGVFRTLEFEVFVARELDARQMPDVRYVMAILEFSYGSDNKDLPVLQRSREGTDGCELRLARNLTMQSERRKCLY